MSTNYTCPECDGSGRDQCITCGQDTDCEACDGTGLDANKIDVRDWSLTVTLKIQQLCEAGHELGSHDLIENGATVGRRFSDGSTLRYENFAHGERKTALEATGYADGQTCFLEDQP